MNTTKNNKKILNNKGFSLAEIMIVMVIIGTIMGIIVPKIMAGRDTSNVNNSRIKMTEIENKINEYQGECNGKLPQTLDFLVTDIAECKNWSSNKQNKQLMTDLWGSPFVYELSGNGYNLKSLGKDKKEGGEGPDKDFYSQGSVANE